MLDDVHRLCDIGARLTFIKVKTVIELGAILVNL